MKRWATRIVALTATIGLLAAGYGVVRAATPAAKPRADGLNLAESVSRASGSAGPALGDPGVCLARRPGEWRCDVTDREGSGGARYRVRVGADGSCWTARLTSDFSEGGMPSRLTGCVRGDRWSPFDLL